VLTNYYTEDLLFRDYYFTKVANYPREMPSVESTLLHSNISLVLDRNAILKTHPEGEILGWYLRVVIWSNPKIIWSQIAKTADLWQLGFVTVEQNVRMSQEFSVFLAMSICCHHTQEKNNGEFMHHTRSKHSTNPQRLSCT